MRLEEEQNGVSAELDGQEPDQREVPWYPFVCEENPVIRLATGIEEPSAERASILTWASCLST